MFWYVKGSFHYFLVFGKLSAINSNIISSCFLRSLSANVIIAGMSLNKASALNTPEGRALRYEPSIRRTANFNKLIVEDKGFRRYLRNMMGDKSGDVDLGSISPRMQDYLAKGYLSLERRLKIKGFR